MSVADTLGITQSDGANAAPTIGPKQADMSQMPFIMDGKLFFALGGVDYAASGNIFMRNSQLTAAHCVQDNITGHLAENFVLERCYAGGLSAGDFTF